MLQQPAPRRGRRGTCLRRRHRLTTTRISFDEYTVASAMHRAASAQSPTSSAPSATAVVKEVKQKLVVSTTALAPPAAVVVAAVATTQEGTDGVAEDASDVDLAPVSQEGLAHPTRPGINTNMCTECSTKYLSGIIDVSDRVASLEVTVPRLAPFSVFNIEHKEAAQHKDWCSRPLLFTWASFVIKSGTEMKGQSSLLPNVWKHLLWKPLLYGIMRDVLYDALILVDYSLICNEAGVDKTDCSLVHTLVSRLITTHDVISEAKSKVEVISPFLPNLKALEGREVYLVAATFRPETLNIKEYLKAFSPFIELKPARFVSEASRESGIVVINSSVALVESFIDEGHWSDMFFCLVGKISILEEISTGVAGSRNSALLLVQAELHVLLPLVPVRKVTFLRYCKQLAPGAWDVVDVKMDEGVIGLDIAASEFHNDKDKTNDLNFEEDNNDGSRKISVVSLKNVCKSFVSEYQIVSIEDPFDQDDWIVYANMTGKIGQQVHILAIWRCYAGLLFFLQLGGVIPMANKKNLSQPAEEKLFGDTDAHGFFNYLFHFYSAQLDSRNCGSNAVWVDARARMTYTYFGDTVYFDNTYNQHENRLVDVCTRFLEFHAERKRHKWVPAYLTTSKSRDSCEA
jgi:hypothetical protein